MVSSPPSIARKGRGTATVSWYTHIAERRVQTSQRVKDPRMGMHLFQQALSNPRIPLSRLIPSPLPIPRMPSLWEIPQTLWVPPPLPTPEADSYPQGGAPPLWQIIVTASYLRARPSRRGTDLPSTGKVLQLRLARLPDVHLPYMSINTESPATTAQRHIDSTFPDSTLSHELVPKNAQVGTKWLHLLSRGPDERRNCLLHILSYQGPKHGTDDHGSSRRPREVQERSVNRRNTLLVFDDATDLFVQSHRSSDRNGRTTPKFLKSARSTR